MLGLKNRRKKTQQANMKRRLIAAYDTRSIFAEQFRTIRANIKFSMPDKTIKTIVVTSSRQGEGKSTNVANLAVVFAQEGKRVLIVDADMRRPIMNYTFTISNTVGLSTILSKQHDNDYAIQRTHIENLYILPSGPIPPNPTELLSSNSFEIFLDEMKKSYDLIIFDAPPILSASDVQILAHVCDGTLLVVNTGTVKKEDVLRAKAILTASKANILGATLNNYKMSKKRQYYY